MKKSGNLNFSALKKFARKEFRNHLDRLSVADDADIREESGDNFVRLSCEIPLARAMLSPVLAEIGKILISRELWLRMKKLVQAGGFEIDARGTSFEKAWDNLASRIPADVFEKLASEALLPQNALKFEAVLEVSINPDAPADESVGINFSYNVNSPCLLPLENEKGEFLPFDKWLEAIE